MSLERRAVTLHAYGECTDPLYGQDCDGIGKWTTDPFSGEVAGVEYWGWFCDGDLYGRAMDI